MDKTFGEKDPNLKYYNRPGAYLICIENGKLACVRTPKGYFLLGGGIEGDESQTDCILRECLEEAGLSVTVTAPLCSADSYTIHPRIGPFHPIQYYYLGTIGERVQDPIELDHTFVWLPLEEIENMYVPQQIWAVQYAMKQE